MVSKKLFIPIIVGLLFGQVLADTDRPFSVVNTLKFGYNDNLYRNNNNEATLFITDLIDLSFRASLSARTDFMAKTRIELLNDSESLEIYPNLYAMLNHSASPRWLLRLTDYYRTGEKSGTGNLPGSNQRYNYYFNQLQGSANYVLNEKNRLEFNGSYGISRHDDTAEVLDATTTQIGASWSRELVPQRTRSTLSLSQFWVEYPDATRSDSYDATEVSVGVNHTINQQWEGNVFVGTTHVRPEATTGDDSRMSPVMRAGVVYTPSPRTRLNADFTHSFVQSDDSRYAGQTTSELRLGAQRSLTAKIMAKATARFAQSEYDANDFNAGGPTETEEDRMDLALSFTYQVNRINFLTLSLRHSQKERTSGAASTDWDQNIVEFGWRVNIE